jgi:hypothetical protein
LKFYFSTDPYAFGNRSTDIDTVTVDSEPLKFASDEFDYVPTVNNGQVVIRDVLRGDANNDSTVDVGDAVYIINFVFRDGPAPITIESGDANFDFMNDVGDASYLINYIFRGGPPPNDIK